MDGLLDFLQTPGGMGLLSAAAAYAAGAQRGTPINNIGKGLLGGIHGYTQAAEQQQMKGLQNALAGVGQPQSNVAALNKATGNAAPTPQNAAVMAQLPQQPAIMRLTPNQLAPYLANPKTTQMAKNLIDYQNLIAKGHEFSPDKDRTDFYGNVISRGVKLPEGMTRDAQGNPAWAGQYPKLMAEYTRNIEDQKNASASNYRLAPSAYTVGGRPVGMSEYQIMHGGRQSQTGGAGLDLSKLTPQQINYLAKQDPEAFANGVSRFNKPTDGQGTQFDSEAEKDERKAEVEVNKTVAQERGKRMEQAEFNLPKTIMKAESALDNVDKILSHPGKGAALGIRGYIDPRNYIPGTEATDFKVRMKQLEGQVFLEGFESLKGGGQITIIEGQNAKDALVRASRAQSPEAFDEAMRDYKAIIKKGLDVARKQAGKGSGNQELDALLQKYGG